MFSRRFLAFFLFFSLGAHAAPVNVLVWVEEPKAFPLEKLERARSEMSRYTGRPTRAIVLHADGRETSDTFAPEDRVPLIMIATHGATDDERDVTLLCGLGEFGTEGIDGRLGEMFRALGPRLDEDLSIVLQSCSTLRGDEASAARRVGRLARELREWGVRRLSVWGARQRMAHDPADSYLPVTRRFAWVKPAAKFGALTAFLGVGASFLEPQSAVATLATAVVAGGSYLKLRRTIIHNAAVTLWNDQSPLDDLGYLVQAGEDVTEVHSVRARALTVYGGTCGTWLQE